MPCAVILTAISVEYMAVRAYLTELEEKVHPQGTVYEEGKFFANNQVWNVGIAEIGAGNPGAAGQAERAIAYFTPQVILFVGVAGGIKDVRLGDVVASTKIYAYESGKAEESFKPRPEIGLSAHNLEQRARAEARKKDWLKRLPSIPEPTPAVFVAPIAAGEKVVASTKSEVFQFLCSNYGDAVAVEMEGIGFLDATHANQQVSAIVIRGISDLIDSKSEVDAQGYQKIAASHASAFAFQVLAELNAGNDNNRPLGTISQTPSSTKERELSLRQTVRPKVERDLLKKVKGLVYSRLDGQLHHHVRLNLSKETQPRQVRPWNREVKVPIARGSQPLPPEISIGQVFEQCFGYLLILGEPGAGKTTTLLDLALELVERAEADPEQLIPVIVDLSDWQPTVSPSNSRKSRISQQNFSEEELVQSILNWLIRKVRERYGVSLQQIQQWLEEKRLVPLLDGLDEVSPEYQQDCVRAINLWLKSEFNSELQPTEVAICCRREPYESYSEKLQLRGAVYLQDLTDKQIQKFLVDVNRSELAESLMADENLLALIRRPLLLSMAIIAYQELEPIQWQQATSAGDRLDLLLDAYIRQMLKQDRQSRFYKKPPSQKQSRKWLEILALQLLQDSETDFLVEGINTRWLSTFLEKSLFTVLAIAFWGLFFAIACWAFVPTRIFWLRFFSSIDPVLIVTVSHTIFWLGFRFGCSFFLVLEEDVWTDLPYIKSVTRALGNLVLNLKQEKVLRKLSSWRATLIPPQVDILTDKLAYLTGLKTVVNTEEGFSGLKLEQSQIKESKNEKLLQHAILITLIVVLLHTFILWTIVHPASSSIRSFILTSCMFFILQRARLELRGGKSFINHFLVRLCLFCTNSIPWNYTRFLNYATERLLLQRTGSSYRFLHDLLRQSLAQSRINSNPDLISPQVFFRCGESYVSMGQYNEALQQFNRAIELEPTYFEAIANRADTYRWMESYEEALQDLKLAIEINPRDDWAIDKRGIIYRLMGNYEDALQQFNRAIELNPRNEQAIANRANIYRLMGNYEDALQEFNRAIELDPRNDWCLYLRGLTYLILHQEDSAKADLNNAIQIAQDKQSQKPDDCQNTFNLALYNLVAGNLSTAQKLYQAALQQGYSQFYIRDAIQDLKYVLRVFPENIAAQEIMATLMEEISNK
ncbi:MAG: tetratricopeptide repeat protein [Symploca sp. SIO3E6]|nr:tetratricopeptide repeat protein [Caldora sp. SIO3E6]